MVEIWLAEQVVVVVWSMGPKDGDQVVCVQSF